MRVEHELVSCAFTSPSGAVTDITVECSLQLIATEELACIHKMAYDTNLLPSLSYCLHVLLNLQHVTDTGTWVLSE